MLWVGIIGIVLGALFIFLAGRQKQKYEQRARTRSLPINQLEPNQQVEIQGTIVAGQPLKTPFSHRDCVFYSYELERQRRVRDRRGRIETKWEKVSEGQKRIPFWVQDQSGKIAVYPEDARIEAPSQGERFLQGDDLFQHPLLRTAANLVGRFQTRVTERALLNNTPVYIFGYVTKGKQGLAVQKGEGDFFY